MQHVLTYNPSTPLWQSFVKFFTAKRLVVMLLASLFILAGLYIYFINTTIRNVVFYTALEKQNALLSQAVDTLQSAYIAQKNTITLTLAYSEGYQDANTPQFISATPAGNAILSYKYP